MPKRGDDPIPDALLLSNGVYDLDRELRLSPQQVQRMTGLSLGTLQEYRRTRPSKPPLAVAREKRGGKVWYPLGEVLDWRRQRNPVQPPGRKPKPTFAAFVTQGAFDEEWVFARSADGRLVDFFESLGWAEKLDSDAECVWLSLDEYLRDTERWVAETRARAQKRRLLAVVDKVFAPNESDPVRTCGRCGRPEVPGHRCRL